jgi:hypothetical protein
MADASSCVEESSSYTSSIPLSLSFTDHLTCRRVSLALIADRYLQSPAQLRVQINSPLELIKANARIFAQRLPGCKRPREEALPPLGFMFLEYSPFVPVRCMFGCVATACRRLATAPAGVHVMYRTTGRWAGWMLERVTRSRVRRVQVRLLRIACCAVRCASRASACVRCVFDACCRKRWLVLRCVAVHRSGCIKRAAAFIVVCRLLLPPALQAELAFWTQHKTETALRWFAI